MSRRQLLRQLGSTGTGLAAAHLFTAGVGVAAVKAGRKFTMDLNPGSIGVSGSQTEIIALAAKHGFESVGVNVGYLSSLDDAGRADLAALMKSSGVVWGAAGLPVDFRGDDATFRESLKAFPAQAAAMQQAGVTRVSTWIKPCHDTLSYRANFKLHAERLRECVKVMNDHGQRFGMEYIGPKTLWTSMRHTFVHTMAEMKELIAEIRQPHVGFVLDSWHWYTAHETADDLRTLTNADVVACDLNDAPAGIEIDQQQDLVRELPSATGVIDLKTFLGVLVEIGYDGPVRSEPFNKPLNALDNDAACAATAAAMKTSFGLIGG